jgi:hypothetical protein
MLLGMVEDKNCPETGTAFHPVGNFSESSQQAKNGDFNQIPVRLFHCDIYKTIHYNQQWLFETSLVLLV